MLMQLGGYPESEARYFIAAKPLNDNSITENYMISQKELKELFHYKPDTGVFTRLISTSPTARKGDIAGSLDDRGYLQIQVKGKIYYTHRLAFLYMTGKWPKDQIDHINHIKGDNRWVNLRDATYQENLKNSSLSKNNKSGVCGVYKYKLNGKWVASIMAGGNPIRLGYFNDKFEAICARMSANNKYGFHKNHGGQK